MLDLKKRRTEILLGTIFLLGAALRFGALNGYLEEGDAHLPICQAVRYLADGNSSILTPRGGLFVLEISWLFRLMGRETILLAKFIPLFFSLLIIPAVYLVALEMTASRNRALALALLSSVNYYLVRDSDNITYYGEFAFFSLVSLFFLLRFRRTGIGLYLVPALLLAVMSRFIYIMGSVLVAVVVFWGIVYAKKAAARIALLVSGIGLGAWLVSLDLRGSGSGDFHFLLSMNQIVERLEHYTGFFIYWCGFSGDVFHFTDISVLEIVSIIALIPAIWYLINEPLLLLYVAGYFIPFLFFEFKNVHYMIPVLPLIWIAWLEGASKLAGIRFAKYAFTGGLLFLILTTIPSSAKLVRDIRLEKHHPEKWNIFYAARLDDVVDWILENAPQGSRIGMSGFFDHYFIFLRGDYGIRFVDLGSYNRDWDEEIRLKYMNDIFMEFDYFILDDVFETNRQSRDFYPDFFKMLENSCLHKDESATGVKMVKDFRGITMTEGVSSHISIFKME